LPERDDQLSHVVAGLAEYYRFIISACKRHYILRHGDIKTYHAKVFKYIVPLDYYAGNYRSADPKKPCLAMEVHVNGIFGETYTKVPASMGNFSAELLDLIVRTDEYLTHTVSQTEKAQAVAQLAAAAMGNFIRIHPFVNGNGRMARMLVNYVFKRYGYRMPFGQAQIRPPELEYAQASALSMGPSASLTPLYVYLLRLVARAASQ
jgi:fido (protein-threonine AMPylation protein)